MPIWSSSRDIIYALLCLRFHLMDLFIKNGWDCRKSPFEVSDVTRKVKPPTIEQKQWVKRLNVHIMLYILIYFNQITFKS